jgi:hypothetical protein
LLAARRWHDECRSHSRKNATKTLKTPEMDVLIDCYSKTILAVFIFLLCLPLKNRYGNVKNRMKWRFQVVRDDATSSLKTNKDLISIVYTYLIKSM